MAGVALADQPLPPGIEIPPAPDFMTLGVFILQTFVNMFSS
jgi:hypothetical protein